MVIVIGIVVLLLGITFVCLDNAEYKSFGIIFIFIAGLLLGSFLGESAIKPIDVYRGKTKLEIKTVMKDSVVISRDSTVVLK